MLFWLAKLTACTSFVTGACLRKPVVLSNVNFFVACCLCRRAASPPPPVIASSGFSRPSSFSLRCHPSRWSHSSRLRRPSGVCSCRCMGAHPGCGLTSWWILSTYRHRIGWQVSLTFRHQSWRMRWYLWTLCSTLPNNNVSDLCMPALQRCDCQGAPLAPAGLACLQAVRAFCCHRSAATALCHARHLCIVAGHIMSDMNDGIPYSVSVFNHPLQAYLTRSQLYHHLRSARPILRVMMLALTLQLQLQLVPTPCSPGACAVSAAAGFTGLPAAAAS